MNICKFKKGKFFNNFKNKQIIKTNTFSFLTYKKQFFCSNDNQILNFKKSLLYNNNFKNLSK